jgi:integrase
VWDIRRNKSSRKPSYEVRWTVEGRQKSRSFATKALADSFRADLLSAMKAGDSFEIASGLPESMLRVRDSMTWYEFARAYVAMKWPHAAAKSRDSMTDALATATPVLCADRPGRPSPEVLRRALRSHGLRPPVPDQGDGEEDERPPADVAAALRWLKRSSVPLVDLMEPKTIRSALDALKVLMDGKPAGAETIRRKRAVMYNALKYGVELGKLPAHPIDAITWKPPKVAKLVDRRVVVGPDKARELLAAVSYIGGHRRARGRRLVALFACMYFAALRPAEAVNLRCADCHLPKKGWGTITLTRTRPAAGKRWTDSGEVHDHRGFKHRADNEIRSVPIPPELVVILRAHLDEFGTAKDGRLFFTERGSVVPSSTYWRVWSEARALAFTPAQVASPLAARPYDLRHAAVSLWLNAGADPTEVAKRAGHSVEVLLKIYAACIDGREEIVNRRIEAALAGDDGGSMKEAA